MIIMVMAVLAFVLTTGFTSNAESAPCPPDTIEISITSAADVRNLTDALACQGEGHFNITWHSSLTIDEGIEVAGEKSMTVTGDALGNDNAAGVIIDGGDGTSIFVVSAGSTLRLNNIGIKGGDKKDGGAVAVLSSSALFVSGCSFTRNNASNGGALFASNSSIYVDGSTSFDRNTAIYGGAIYAESSNVGIDGNASFTSNSAGDEGGAVHAWDDSNIDIGGNAMFMNNSAFDGGAVFTNHSEVGIDGNAMFTQNSAGQHGGAVLALHSEVGIDDNATFTHNSAGGGGGAVWVLNSKVGIDDNATVTHNSAGEDGGAVWALASEVGIDDNATFTHNSAGKGGGAVWAINSTVGIDGNATFTHNSAGEDGGAVWTIDSEVGIDSNAMFTQNSAGQLGGSVWAINSEVGIDGNATFTHNSAGASGGAVWAIDSKVCFDDNATVTHNSAGEDGGAVWAINSEVGIDGNATFTHNSAGAGGGSVWAIYSEVGIDGNATFTHNSAGGGGGAVWAIDSKVGIDGNAAFTHNSAGEEGGAVWTLDSEVGIDGNAMFTQNSAGQLGGAVWAKGSNVGIEGNVTVTHNSVGDDGGAFWAFNSTVGIDGNATFTHNSAGDGGGAIYWSASKCTISGSKKPRGGLSGDEGGLYSDAGGDYTFDWSVVFVNNSAAALGGAIYFVRCDQVQVGNTMFKSNKASLGGAVYVLAVDDRQSLFSECVLEGNTADDGGALYLYTGPGVDIFNASFFRDNFASTSGGAIFHTGSMRVFNTSFVANKARVEGPAVMSVGFLDVMYNVNFSENAYYCPAGKYGYIEKNEAHFCSSCFEEVCSRCSTLGDAVSIREEVRIDGKPVCAAPPVGATAPVPGTTIANITLQKGFFRTSNKSHNIMQCYQKGACNGGNDTDKYCTSGYTGPYCAVCVEAFAPGRAYSCRECSGDIARSAVGLAVAVGLAALFFSGALLSNLGKVVHDGAEEGIEMDQSLWKNKIRSCRASMANMLPVRAIKITVTVWQIVSQFDAIAGDVYPKLYQTFVSKLNPFNLNLDFVFSYSCLVRNDFYDHVIFATITPLVTLVLLAGSLFVRNKMYRGSESVMREVRHKHQAVVLFIAFLVYSPVSYRIFQMFGCDELDDGTTYLRADYSLSCSTYRHSWYRVYAFIMVAVYPIGIPAAFAGLLFMHRRDLVKTDRGTMLHLKPLNGIWAAYKPSRYYYEVVECGRRIALTVIAAFILPNSAAQISIALLFAVVYVFISEVLSPFQKGIDTSLYRCGNGIVVASMYVAFLTKVDVGQDTASAGYILTFSGVLIAANIFMVVTVLIQTVLLATEMRAMKNAVRVIDIPVRRTHSVSLRGLSPVEEGEECSDWIEDI